MLRTFPSERKKAETNSMPLSEVTCDGTPCLEKTWRMNNLARSGDVMVSTVGMKRDCLVSLSTMTSIVSKPEDGGNFSMKSMDMEFHGLSGIGSCFRSPYGRCLCDFEHIQVVQDLT